MKKIEDAIITGELVGKYTSVTINKQKIEGIITDETKNTFKICTDGATKTIIKDYHCFTFTLDGKSVMIKGTDLTARPEERLKKWLKKRRI